MSNKPQYYIVEASALPEVFLKVAETKRLLSTGEATTVNEATRMTDISRSAFYKYRDSVFFYEDHDKSRVVTYSLRLSDDPGVLSKVLTKLSDFHVNILTVNQNIPVDRVAVVTIFFRVYGENCDLDALFEGISAIGGVITIKRI